MVHNDIKPQNLFFRGSEVFIAGKIQMIYFYLFFWHIITSLFKSDFDVATLNDVQNDYGTALYASKNFWHEKDRTAMDDLESLLYTMWSVAGVPVGGPDGNYPEGRSYLDHYLNYTEDRWMMVCNELRAMVTRILYKINVFAFFFFVQEKLNYFTDDDVKKAFKNVHNEVISWGAHPYYDDLMKEFDIAITNVRMKTGQIEFEWLKNGATSRSDTIKITQKRLKETSNIKATRIASPRVTKNEFSRLLSPTLERPPNINNPPRLSRFAGIDETTTQIFQKQKCNPICFKNKKLKEKVSSKILNTKLDFQLLKSKFMKK